MRSRSSTPFARRDQHQLGHAALRSQTVSTDRGPSPSGRHARLSNDAPWSVAVPTRCRHRCRQTALAGNNSQSSPQVGAEPTPGFEPGTARLQVGCAANCATPADPPFRRDRVQTIDATGRSAAARPETNEIAVDREQPVSAHALTAYGVRRPLKPASRARVRQCTSCSCVPGTSAGHPWPSG